MTTADLVYLVPLFELTDSLTDDEDHANITYGFGERAEGSQLARDDEGMAGYYVSHAVIGGFAAALDHAITLKHVVTRAGIVTYAAPWTLLRGVLEPASVAAWILTGNTRRVRRKRALQVWHHDMTERGTWEDDIGHVAQPPAKHGKDRAKAIVDIAKRLELRPNQVTARLSHADCVANAGDAVGWPRKHARALWRECSGFAHGRTWPLGFRSSVSDVTRIRSGFSAGFGLAEEHHEKVARLTYAVLERALREYADASAGRSTL